MDVIEVEHLHKRYRDHVAVQDVSFAVQKGEIFGVLGPNGAGKTTTVECVSGLRVADGGTLRVLGLDPHRDHDKLTGRVGVQLQESQLPDKMRVKEALQLYGSFYPDPMDWRQLLDDWGLVEKANAQFGKLSGGQKQRLFIALSLIGRPEIAILDELTTGLDPAARRDTWGLVEDIRARGVTVLLVTHFMAEAERLCDRVAVIDRGRVVALDSPAGLVSSIAAEQRIRFKPSVPVPDGLLSDLPEVTSIRQVGPQLEVSGTGDVLQAVTSVLARHRIVAADLRVEQASLDDAFVALTGQKLEETH
ncbi:ABC transporter ATP-binding protein [Kutzneria sp. CA-103260]|uniref:ABC transporter ATP-binding protein n=1 Tax=Kutzneria sp. CA-103260 TaxID=2802641 RepID=UPI001BAD91DB|nr:ABC transporter ATP-binding protein [Kutzneria sp. CA-103260]QUQ72184.1 ABC transporter ATP-binding protein [Kutzneria sp. CA-103260]